MTLKFKVKYTLKFKVKYLSICSPFTIFLYNVVISNGLSSYLDKTMLRDMPLSFTLIFINDFELRWVFFAIIKLSLLMMS